LPIYSNETALDLGKEERAASLTQLVVTSRAPVINRIAGILVCATGTNIYSDVPISFEYDLFRRPSTEPKWDMKMGHTSHSATAGVMSSAAIHIFEVLSLSSWR
jgi:hypothetical protein